MQFKDVVGQGTIKSKFIQEIRSHKISHAKLFLGEPGFGGLALTLAYIQYLFCENKQETDSCGICSSCLKVADLQHPDLHFTYPTILAEAKTSKEIYKTWREKVKQDSYFDLSDWIKTIDPAKGRKPVIGSEESLEIIKSLALKSFEGGFKIVVIWGVEEMNTTAANKLLKILEEPPADTLFFLLASNQDTLLQTILSRTILYKIPKIDTSDLSKHLQHHFQLQLTNADNVALRSEGDYHLAQQLLNNHTNLDEDRELFIELMRVCFKKDVIKMLDWSENISNETKERQKMFIKYCLNMFRQSILKNYTSDMLVRVSDEESAFLKNFARFISGNNIVDFNHTFNDAHYYIERNANTKIVFTNLCFNVMRYIHAA